MTMRRMLFAFLFCAGCLTAAADEAIVSIRLVEGSAKAAPMPAELMDVARTLKILPNLKGFRLISSKTVKLPANGSIALTNQITIGLKGPQSALAVLVTAAQKKIIATTLSLKTNRPFVTNLPIRAAGGNRFILIVLAKNAKK